MFDFIIKKYQQKQLFKLKNTARDKCIINWNDIKSIGLIFIVGTSEQWNIINRFISVLAKQGKQVYLIGLHPKGFNIDYIFTHTDTAICKEKEDFNLLGMPKPGLIEPFISRHFDLVIDATVQPCFFGKLVSAASSAPLKVAYSSSETTDEGIMDIYDLIIKGSEAINFKDYIEQIVKYLSMIKK